MQFTPELNFDGGRVRPLAAEDRDALFRVYQQPELPGQRPLQDPAQLDRMIELSVQMAATQRGMMWALEVGSEGNYELLGVVGAFDWQPSMLRITLRIDGLPELGCDLRAAALETCIGFLSSKYHLRNFAFQWVDGQNPAYRDMLTRIGFSLSARQRDGWRTAEQTFVDVELYHRLLDQDVPDPTARAGE
ncbi:GNAT family N-acetyltransferase [Parathalassolituus penaei]|uniref:GNAT family N-acetyltransferase n=1 Tax=Parathalassolituus penaei TaxID=2997323 RepID=A0A9X3ELJ6_9GAMM|nr:GNAT family N-acetyltransferase [Parathalassolituus penaei]MCY0964873.1 GNAT family N-acetyltransferase [Parathalassolituus penaei]